MEFNKTQTVNFTSKLSDFEVIDTEFTKCKCYALASGDNVNGSDITMQAIDKAIQRGEFYNKPIVAHLYRDENDGSWRVGGHDSKWVISNTSMEVINECIPFGTIPESSNVRKEEVLEPDGTTVNTYVVMDVILWTGRFNIMDAAYSDDVYFNQSCEISINDYHYKDNDILAIDDFTFSALCLLNKSSDFSKNVRPCFPSCRVEKIKSFSLDEDKFKQNFELMLDKLKQYESATTAVHDKETNNKPNKEEKVIMDFKKINDALSTANGESDVNKYRLLNVTDSKVFALDMEDYKPYGFDYAVTTEDDTENVVIDFDSKVEMSLSATDKITEENFEEFDIKSVIDSTACAMAEEKTKENTSILEAEFNKKMEEMKTAYEDISASYSVAMKKVEEYEAKENEAKAQAHREEVAALFEKYSEKLGKCAEFLVYKAKCNPDEVTLDEVSEKLTLMVGKFTMESNTKKNFSYNPTETGVAGRKNETVENKYGHLLDKYMK